MRRSQLLFPWPNNTWCDVKRAQLGCNLFALLNALLSRECRRHVPSYRQAVARTHPELRRARQLALRDIADAVGVGGGEVDES